MEIEKLYKYYKECDMEVTTDSRNVPKGALFFALVGERFDGNDFALKAIENGAKYAVVSRPELGQDPRCIVVQDTLKALQQLARHHRDSFKRLKVVAITGTNGKTTTKELLATILIENRIPTLYTEGNLNNHIGVPLTLLRLRSEHQVAVIEMGASKPGDIKELVEIANPKIGLITNIGAAHLQGFGSIENILQTKSELYDYLIANKGIIVLNLDDKRLREKWQDRYIMGYKLGFSDDIQIKSGRIVDYDPYLTMEYYENGLHKGIFPISTYLVGSYNAHNVLAAITLAYFCQVSFINSIYAISNYHPTNNRSQLIQGTRGRRLIIDAYNANPTSMQAAIDNLYLMDSEHYCLILGDMMELGEASEEAHLQVTRWIKRHPEVEAYLCGPQFMKHKHLFTVAKQNGYIYEEQAQFYDSVDNLLKLFKEYPSFDDNTTILLKGSHSTHLEKLIPYLIRMINE